MTTFSKDHAALLLRQYAKTMAMEGAAVVGESPLFLFTYLLRLMRVLALLAIWRTVMEGRGVVSGMNLPSVLTYTLISEACAELLACRGGIDTAWFNGS